ncbi:MAG: hypothetical protein RL757_1938 [Bacteroidota bacterium]|jgi:alpha-beta hydrolase superfamily lysophospholipase
MKKIGQFLTQRWKLLTTTIFLMMNIVAYFHAYKFTHFSDSVVQKSRDASKMGIGEKLTTLAFGVNNPRPQNDSFPNLPFENLGLTDGKTLLAAWYVKVPNARGTVAVFHGFSGNRSSMVGQSAYFNQLGFNTLILDFRGTGGSAGNVSTLGYHEADDVKQCFEFLKNKGEENIIFYGESMGAVALLRAAAVHNLKPQKIIAVYPFGSMLKTVQARFRNMGIPSFPMSQLLVFWGGMQHDFWAFSHRPTDYATKIEIPTLLMYGEKDKTVSAQETQTIFDNLKGQKILKTFPDAGHENISKTHETDWKKSIEAFLNQK